jgi:hypothetical protein
VERSIDECVGDLAMYIAHQERNIAIRQGTHVHRHDKLPQVILCDP